MVHRRALLALLPFASLLACSVGASSRTSDADLIGGRPAEEGEFPATMKIRGGCTVSKVGPRHVLTAAHCVGAVSPGALIELSASQTMGAFAQGKGDGYRSFRIERVEVEPAWKAWCAENRCGLVHVAGRTQIGDAALLILTEDIPDVPEAAIDLSPVSDGDEVALTGYGCEDAVGSQASDVGSRLRVAHTSAIDFSQTIHAGSFISEQDRGEGGVLDTMSRIYVITPGPAYVTPRITASEELDGGGEDGGAEGGGGEDGGGEGDGGEPTSGRGPQRGGLCPGDSGGPLYRVGAGSDGRTVVGINANYTFSGGNAYSIGGITFNYGGEPTTNWHTRVDGTYGLQVGAWLASLGVNTVCTKGDCPSPDPN